MILIKRKSNNTLYLLSNEHYNWKKKHYELLYEFKFIKEIKDKRIRTSINMISLNQVIQRYRKRINNLQKELSRQKQVLNKLEEI